MPVLPSSPYPILLRITREFDQNNIDRGWEVAYFFLFRGDGIMAQKLENR